MAPPAAVRLRSRDGVPLAGRFRPGPGQGSTAVLLAHGFSGSTDAERVAVVAERLSGQLPVLAIDQRGHGRSGGRTSLGHTEPMDVDAGCAWLREQGYARVATLGFSMGAAVVLRHGALCTPAAGFAGTDAVVAVSGPAFWYYKGTVPMRWLHRAIGTSTGRAYLRLVRGTHVDARPWPDPPPMPPTAAAARVRERGLPLLLVHGDADPFFPLDHPAALADAAPGAEVWIERGFGHAEGATSADLVDRMGAWIAASGSGAKHPPR